ncbi:hypothetical protein KIS4809_3837 [Bacillus sp. ZZV12-4809]|nr:hypothetical protein KIS4809_3837 [Bacillus sp. ZZV12-4809]
MILTVNPSLAYPNTGVRERLAVFLFQEIFPETALQRCEDDEGEKE